MIRIEELFKDRIDIFDVSVPVINRPQNLGERGLRQMKLPLGFTRIDFLDQTGIVHIENLKLRINSQATAQIIQAKFELPLGSSINLDDGLNPPIRRFKVSNLPDQS